jgi:hypothetical protein
LITFPTPISVSKGEPLQRIVSNNDAKECDAVNYAPIPTGIELFPVEKGPDVMYRDLVWTASVRSGSWCARSRTYLRTSLLRERHAIARRNPLDAHALTER